MIRHRELQASGAASPGFGVLLGQAFAVIAPPASRE